jgi:ribosomal-protein-alanine N-acetyltransferase
MEPFLPAFQLARLAMTDLDEVMELENLVYAQPWTETHFRGEFARPFTLALGLKNDQPGSGLSQPLAAYCFFWLLGPEIHLLNLAVRPEYRRRGLGRRLLGAMLDIGHRAGGKYVFLEVRQNNREAQGLYLSSGFTVTGRRPGYYEDGEDAHLMTLNLSGNRSLWFSAGHHIDS